MAKELLRLKTLPNFPRRTLEIDPRAVKAENLPNFPRRSLEIDQRAVKAENFTELSSENIRN